MNQSNDIAFSICIPIYNCDVSELVMALHGQAMAGNYPFEMLLIDDQSSVFIEKNRSLKSLLHLTYIELDENIGRSRIRNLLAQQAQYPYLIFIDCDACVTSNSCFLQNYIQALPADVIIGGCGYYQTPPSDIQMTLRWKYGIQREMRSASTRKLQPYRSFSSFNFVVKKDIFQQIQFEETLIGYGHEDSLFGWNLKKRHLEIKHIDNYLIHNGLDSGEVFINKINNSIQNLWHIYSTMPEKKMFAEDNSLLKCYNSLQKYHLTGFITGAFWLFRSIVLQNLLSNHPQIFWLDFYKLGILNQTAKSETGQSNQLI